MTVPIDIIRDSLERLGVYAPGEPISGPDSSRGLSVFADMVDNWIDDSIQLFQITMLTAHLVTGQQIYTVGSLGNVSSPQRPTRAVMGVSAGSLTVNNASPVVTYSLSSVSALEWNSIYNSTDITGNPGIPQAYFYDPTGAFPLGLLSFSLIPNAPMTAQIPFYFPLSGFTANLYSPNVTLAPGQKLAFETNLAVLLHPYFAGGQVTPDLVGEAQRSKTLLTLTNRVSRAMSARNVQPQVPAVPKP